MGKKIISILERKDLQGNRTTPTGSKTAEILNIKRFWIKPLETNIL